MTGSLADAVRMLRVAVASLVVVGLGSSAHVAGGVPGPQPVAVAVLVLLVVPLVRVGLRSRTSAGRLFLAMAAGQVVAHVGLLAMTPTAGAGTRSHVHGDAATVAELVHRAGAPASPVTSESTSGAVAMTAAALHLTPGMVTLHLVATVLAAVVLSRGEDAVRSLVQRLLPSVRRPAATQARAVLPAAGRTPLLVGRLLTGPLGGRAPPLPAS